MQKKTNSPRVKLMMKKLANGFNPFNPTVELANEVKRITLPSSGYLGKAMRGKTLKELTLEQLEYYAFDLKQGDEKNKFVAKLYYFYRLTKVMEDEGLTRADIMEMVDDTLSVNPDSAIDKDKQNDDELDF